MGESMGVIIVGGLFGGFLRGLLGLSKTLLTKKDATINYGYFFLNLLISAVVGVVAALMLPVDFKFAILAGYAGSDFLETLYKIKLQTQLKEEK